MNFSSLKQVTDVAVSQDGNLIQLRIDNADGKSVDLAFPSHDFHKFIEDFIGVAAQASAIRTNNVPVPIATLRPTTFSSNRLTAIGIGESSDRISMYLIIRLGDFDLSFQFDKTTLQTLSDDLALAAKTISAEEGIQH